MPPPSMLAEKATPAVDQLTERLADELAPQMARSTNPLAQTDMERAQIEAWLERAVREHVDELSGDRLLDLGKEITQSPSNDPGASSELQDHTRNLQENSQILRDVLFSALTGTDRSGIRELTSLSPEERQKAEENLRSLLDTVSDNELAELHERIGARTGRSTETREDLIEALMESNLLERSMSDPSVASSLSEALAASGKLSPELSASLREVIREARETLERIKEAVSKEIQRRIQRYIEESIRNRGSFAGESISFTTDTTTNIVWPMYVEFLRALEDGEERKLFEPAKRKDDEVQQALNQVEAALREREKKEEKQELERRDTEADLKREIARIARQNPGLFNSLIGSAIEQTSFLDPTTVARRTPPFGSAFD